ncbi:dipeptidase [Gemmatirosa kalamazoonensis]|uniref:dipeptidase n=1 Tax=Gemmatirosa kalamazoonensis TaxID=861299 RepID=UPI00046C9925|nr:dipeptidase [Gemmatirosa kalamazoonensis]
MATAADAQPAAQPSDAALRARVERLLKSTPLIDGHNDLPWAIREAGDRAGKHGTLDVEGYDLRQHTTGQTDFARMAQGHLAGQFWSVYIPGEPTDPAYARDGAVTDRPGYAAVQLEQIDVARRIIARYPDKMVLATKAADVMPAFRAGKIPSFLGMEGGHAIDNSLSLLRTYYDLGVRYMTLTHNVTLDWADAALDTAKHGGLTPFGREVVREMNRLGMLVDLSHTSPGTMSSALDVTEAPVIFSHSSARAIADHPRDVPDSILARLPKNGGVVMVTFVPSFISQAVYDWQKTREAAVADARRRANGDTAAARAAVREWEASHPEPKTTVKDVADHVEHVRKVAGIDHVGLGGDYDGNSDWPEGMTDVTSYPMLFVELARRGWSDADLAKLASGNVLRALREAEAVSARLRRSRPASAATIRELDRPNVTHP